MTTTARVADHSAWIDAFFARVDDHDFEWVEAALTPDCHIDAPGFDHSGAEIVVLWMAGFFAAFPDLRHRPHRVVSSAGEAAFLVEVTGTHNGDLADPDGNALAPTGKAIRVELAEFWRFDEDRLAEYKVIYNHHDLLSQLGVA
jgi:predicted ester cyclase